MSVPGEDGEPPATIILSPPRSPSPRPASVEAEADTSRLRIISSQLDRVASLQRYIDRRREIGIDADPPSELRDSTALSLTTVEHLAEEVETILSSISPVVTREEDDLEALFYSSLRAGTSSRLRRFRDMDAPVVIGTSNERSTSIDEAIQSMLDGNVETADDSTTTWAETRNPIGRSAIPWRGWQTDIPGPRGTVRPVSLFHATLESNCDTHVFSLLVDSTTGTQHIRER